MTQLPEMGTQWEPLLRMLVALVLGAAVGWEREMQRQPAGFRTHALVGLGSAIFTVVSAFAFPGPLSDPTRIAAQIVTGVGFLGGGAILHYRGSVRGLTTAASLWAVAAVGMAAGAGLTSWRSAARRWSSSRWRHSIGLRATRDAGCSSVASTAGWRGAGANESGSGGSVVTLLSTRIEGLPLVHRGKVRETYAIGDDRLLLVATDRLSAFDVVFDQPIPDKGRVLTQLSAWWFERLADLGPSHFISADARDLPRRQPRRPSSPDARCSCGGGADRCGMRGAWLPGRFGLGRVPAQRQVVGHQLPDGLREADRLPEPIFTPSTKAEVGHDENITREQLADLVGADVARQLEERSLALYRAGAELASAVGLILADTKFEFGVIDGRIALIDEVFTPDSSRFWDAARYRAGLVAAQLRQAVRARFRGLVRLEQGAPAPTLPDDVIAGTRDRYVTAYSRLTGRAWQPPEDAA